MALRLARRLLAPALVFASVVLGGCGTSPLGDEFRQTITLDRLGRAALDSLASPDVWVPLAAAGIFAIDDFDERASKWALDHTPLFGSQSGARSASDILLGVSAGSAATMWAVRPTSDPPADGATDAIFYTGTDKTRDLIIGGSAIALTYGVSDVLKESIHRRRPHNGNDGDGESFPSAHASFSAAAATTARHHFARLDGIDEPLRDIGDATLIAMPYVAGWARVEGKRHYPSDVLFGIALGNFFATMGNKLIEYREQDRLRDPLEPRAMFYAAPAVDGESVMVGVVMEF